MLDRTPSPPHLYKHTLTHTYIDTHIDTHSKREREQRRHLPPFAPIPMVPEEGERTKCTLPRFRQEFISPESFAQNELVAGCPRGKALQTVMRAIKKQFYADRLLGTQVHPPMDSPSSVSRSLWIEQRLSGLRGRGAKCGVGEITQVFEK